ncbi:MAG: hypothetical protein PF485_07005 [Bacteroidales bacterium]|jgi:AcrR family transcriptional regulator|nr:hypothetical protein [Bacteroidales bacterium]
MEIKKTEIIEKAAHIIMNRGLEALTIRNLATELKIDKKELYNLFTKDDDILLMMFDGFENELKEFIHKLRNNDETAEKEFKSLFKSLYNLFLQKPYYLSIIFDKSLKKRDESIKMSILRMKDLAEKYLTTLINTGKKDSTFKTKTSTKLLVGKMLSEFRLLMRDEQYFNKMVLELKTLKKSKD